MESSFHSHLDSNKKWSLQNFVHETTAVISCRPVGHIRFYTQILLMFLTDQCQFRKRSMLCLFGLYIYIYIYETMKYLYLSYSFSRKQWPNKDDAKGVGVRTLILIRHGKYDLNTGKLTDMGRSCVMTYCVWLRNGSGRVWHVCRNCMLSCFKVFVLVTAQPPRTLNCLAQWWCGSYFKWLSDAIWLQGSGSTLAQVMACCLTAPSHHLNQCWLIISKVQWHSSEGSLIKDTSTISNQN